MKYQDKESGVYGSEYRLLTRANRVWGQVFYYSSMDSNKVTGDLINGQ